jgi:hypothetical protein
LSYQRSRLSSVASDFRQSPFYKSPNDITPPTDLNVQTGNGVLFPTAHHYQAETDRDDYVEHVALWPGAALITVMSFEVTNSSFRIVRDRLFYLTSDGHSPVSDLSGPFEGRG